LISFAYESMPPAKLQLQTGYYKNDSVLCF
jgi:hypothetical protein